ncbi:MAG TPA: hypothetical protein VFE17_03170 [Candidatus Baltobacteraceae bacterium]|jgi:hypothetical protein|nr:hypothetical protein [Candidatus Baltobacteraceae bacterium]
MSARLPAENSDTVNLVCALLVRYPEIASMRCTPGEGTVQFTFAVTGRLDKKRQQSLTDDIAAHVEGFLTLAAEGGEVRVDCESDRAMSFVHVTRDLDTFTKDELAMLTGLFAERFAGALVRNPVPEEHPDEDPAFQEELVECAIEALRDPAQSKSLVGFREEKRVLVYFLKSQKKAKASARR